ncbi:MAG: sigma-70 family RNA polymerase sigma factor [Deltaproteobacteria bacterium]|nr:sigma-70 family RNA polymerase sigma factor [Deltaproteobacteria bacterium]
MESSGMTIERFIDDFSPAVKRMAWRFMKHYSGWFKDPGEELKDLYAVGMLSLVSIFREVDFQNGGYKSYVLKTVQGSIHNYINKNVPHDMFHPLPDEVDPDKKKGNRPIRFACSVSFEEIMETPHEPVDDIELEILLFRHQVLGLISEFMKNLKPKEQFMLIARYQDEKSYEKIGALLDKRRETVSENIRNILERLAKFLRRKCSWRLAPEDIDEYLQETDLSIN